MPSRAKKKEPVALSRGVFALAKTKRKRFLWCAWWTGEPTVKPFRPPDAWGGGANTREEAQVLAERAAARPLTHIDDHWAGAWKRVVAGLEPFPKRFPSRRTEPAVSVDPYVVLGMSSTATLAEVRLAFRREALKHHPDQGGDAESFLAARRAYELILKKRARKSK